MTGASSVKAKHQPSTAFGKSVKIKQLNLGGFQIFPW